ncbi:hypothetical protein L1887_00947 [Cichorium endivia]|nr:hypothetical protein L1887_00947 [Cichorium endivia]
MSVGVGMRYVHRRIGVIIKGHDHQGQSQSKWLAYLHFINVIRIMQQEVVSYAVEHCLVVAYFRFGEEARSVE